MREAGRWGQGFAERLFDNRFELDNWHVVGSKHLRLNLRLPGHPTPIEAIQFNADTSSAPPSRLHVAYQLDVNEWNGRSSVQLLVRHMQAD